MVTNLADSINRIYEGLVSIFPEKLQFIPTLFFISIGIAVYGIFIWLFYRFLSEKDALKLNLNQYNKYKHAGIIKLFGVLFYIIEFVIISPIIIFIWFSIFSIFMIILAKEVEVGSVILICAALISAIRICAYFKEDLARDIAKLIPLTLLGVSIMTPGFLNIETGVNRIMEVSLFFQNALYYLIFIVVLELILRLLYIPFLWIKSEEDENNDSSAKNK